MQERIISFEEVEELLQYKVDTITIQSKKDENIFLLLGFVRGRGIAIIYNKKTYNLITVRRMRKNEEGLF